MSGLVLSLFPGVGLLDRAFEEVGYCVVRGPDVLWGGDVHKFHPPARRFDGVIGGPPCQAFSELNKMVRQNGNDACFGNLIPEFERVVAEAAPRWFLMENVKAAPLPAVHGYGVHSFLLNNRQLGEVQSRLRRWSFGYRGERRRLEVETVVFESEEAAPACTRECIIPGNIAKRMDREERTEYRRKNRPTFERLCELQGLPADFDLPPFTEYAKRIAVCNGVPIPMGRAMAQAVIRATAAQFAMAGGA